MAFSLCMSLSLNFTSCPITFNLVASLKNDQNEIDRLSFHLEQLMYFTHVWYDGWSLIFGECIRCVMHYTVVVVSGIEMAHFLITVLCKIARRALHHIFIMNCDKIITIVCALHVMKTKCWKTLHRTIESLTTFGWSFDRFLWCHKNPNVIITS